MAPHGARAAPRVLAGLKRREAGHPWCRRARAAQPASPVIAPARAAQTLADDSPQHSGFSCMYKTRSPAHTLPGVACARPAPAQARLAPNSKSNSKPKSRRVKPCPNSTAAASSEPCWVGSPSPAAQASWLQRQRTRPRSLALPPRHRQDRAPSKRRKALWSGRGGGGAGGAAGGAAAAFAVGAGSSPTRLREAGKFRRAGDARPPARRYPDDRRTGAGSSTAKGERTPLSGFPSMSIGRKGGQEWLNRNERG